MSRLFAASLVALIGLLPARAEHGHARTADDPHGEHAIALSLLPAKEATHRAQASGDWSDPATWDGGVPTAGARVLIPESVTVKIRTELEPALDTLRLDGTLRFAATANTRLRVGTILVTATGRLQIGTEFEPVHPDRMARITFTPRSTKHRRNDAYDLSGGLIALGRVELYGAEYRGFAAPKEALKTGTRKLLFDEAPRGWKSGDELLFPASTSTGRDERRTISAIADSGKTIHLSAPLESDHQAPAGITSAVPIGNLSRNVVLESEDPGTIAHRAHLMFMTHTGVHLSGSLFRGLGRTETTRIHTLPEKRDDGSIDPGDNPIGRYAVHYHLRSGASLKNAPLQFTGNVIVDSPKHGLVNHGGYVVAENNVTYDVHGSHFFAENGSEIGAFRNNLAVYSRGSGDKVRSRDCLYDFGHGGHGFWTQSPAVVMEGNYAFHHADAGYVIFPRPVYEFGKLVTFSRDNLADDIRGSAKGEQVSPGMIPFRFERNAAGNCGKGLETWNVNRYAMHNVPSVVAGCQFWDTPAGGIEMPYTLHTLVRDTVVQGRPENRYLVFGIRVNTSTRFLTLERVTISGFHIGFEVPVRGHTLVADSRFDNNVNLRVTSPVQPGRRTVLQNNSFTHGKTGDIDYELADPDCKFNGDLSLLFDCDALLVADPRFPGQTVYFAQQRPDAVPFRDIPVEQLRGKSARQLWDEYGLAIAGSLAPAKATKQAGVRGLVGPVTDELHRAIEETAAITFADDTARMHETGGEYTIDQNLDRVRFVKGKPGEPSGWRFDTQMENGRRRTKLVYVDSTPPHFDLSPCVKLEIHPDDVKHGIEICGILHDEVGGTPTIKNMLKEFKDLKVDPDGYVTVNYTCSDSVGNAAEHTYRFKVTEDAPRRGKNIGYYNQKEYMPPELPVEVATKKKSGRWWWIGGTAAGVTLAALGLRLGRNRKANEPV